MRPIIRTQIILEVLEMETDSCLRDREMICNLLIALTISSEPEHLQLPGPKVLLQIELSPDWTFCLSA